MKEEDNEILYLRIEKKSGEIIATTALKPPSCVPKEFLEEKTLNTVVGEYRNIHRTYEDKGVTVQIVVREDAPSFQGNAARKRAAELCVSFLPVFKNIKDNERNVFRTAIRRFSHNLSKFQDKFKEPFARLIPETSRGKPFTDLRVEVLKQITKDVSTAAYDIATMSLRATDLDAQVETLRMLGGFRPAPKRLIPVNIKKAMYRLTNPFIQRLSEKGINIAVSMEENGSLSPKADIDHQLFNASIWQIFDNACKYVFPNSTIDISMDMSSVPKKLFIRMKSVTIDSDELLAIFGENFRGRHAKKVKLQDDQESSGIGLHIVKKALQLMNAKIYVINNGKIGEIDDVPYSDHIFTIEFSRSASL